MASESTQKKLSRVRPPRVHITYDVEIGDAIQLKEILLLTMLRRVVYLKYPPIVEKQTSSY